MQYLYNRPVLTLVDLLEGVFPLANLVPAATLGWAIEQGYIGKDFFKVRFALHLCCDCSMSCLCAGRRLCSIAFLSINSRYF